MVLLKARVAKFTHCFGNKNHQTSLQTVNSWSLRSSCRRSNCWFDHPTGSFPDFDGSQSRAMSLDRASHRTGQTVRLCHYGYYCDLVELMQKKMKIKIMVLGQLKRWGSNQSFVWCVVLHELPHWFVLVSGWSILIFCDVSYFHIWPFIPVDGMVFTFPIYLREFVCSLYHVLCLFLLDIECTSICTNKNVCGVCASVLDNSIQNHESSPICQSIL